MEGNEDKIIKRLLKKYEEVENQMVITAAKHEDRLDRINEKINKRKEFLARPTKT